MCLLFFKPWFWDTLQQAFCWTLIHSLWQGMVAGILAGVIIYSTKRTSSQVRYNLLLCVLLFFIGVSLFTFVYLLLQANGRMDLVETTVPYPSTGATEFSHYAQAIHSINKKAFTNSFIHFLNINARYIVFVWFGLFAANALRLLTGFCYISHIRHYGTSRPSFSWRNKVEELAIQLNIRQSVILLQSELVKIPVVIGCLKPVILVPLGFLTSLPASQVESILLHELAHITRKDYLVNLLQSIAEAIFFFNPAILWLSSLIRQEREACCDDVVIACTGNKKTYVEALLTFQENYNSSDHAMALVNKRNHLLNRVKRMLHRENIKLNIMEKIILLTGSAIFIMAFSFISKSRPFFQNAKVTSANLGHPAVFKEAKQNIREEPASNGIYSIPATQNKDTIPDITNKKSKSVKDSMASMAGHSIENNNEESTSVVQTSSSNGKKYKLVKENGKIILLQINGKVVPKDEYEKYNDVIEELEQRQMMEAAQARERAVMNMEKTRQQMDREAYKKIIAMKENQKMQAMALAKVQVERDQQMEKQETLAKIQNHLLEVQNRKMEEEAYQRQIEEFSNERNKAALEEARMESHGSSNRIEDLIEDLKAAGIISNNEPLSFSLDDKELMVNGKKQSEDVCRRFKEKYIKKSGDIFKYFHQNGTTQITIKTD